MIGDDDLSIFESDFGETVVFGGSITVKGIFNRPSHGVALAGSLDVTATKPSITCMASDVTDVRNRMSAVIDGETYTVEQVMPAGNGYTDVWLKT